MIEVQEYNPKKQQWKAISKHRNITNAEIFFDCAKKTYAEHERYKDYKTQLRVFDKTNNTIILV